VDYETIGKKRMVKGFVILGPSVFLGLTLLVYNR